MEVKTRRQAATRAPGFSPGTPVRPLWIRVLGHVSTAAPALDSRRGRCDTPGMQQGTPPTLPVMLIVPDAPVAIGWYTEALGAELLWDLGGVAALHLAGAPFLLHEPVPGKEQESSPADAGLTTTRIEVFVDAPEELVEAATRAGATDVEPVTDHGVPWGTHRQGGFTDPFGHRWSVGDRSPLQALPR